MKITEEALELAKAAGEDSDAPLWLVGEKGVITDVMIAMKPPEFDTSAGMLPVMLPAGVRHYGKVITRNDRGLEPGYNLLDENGAWKFVDEAGEEVAVAMVKSGDERDQ